MPSGKAPPPSKAAERLMEYLEIVRTAQAQRGKVLWYDFYRRAGNPYHTDRNISYLVEKGLITGNKDDGYTMTERGETWYDILKKHRDLVGALTRELSGDRRKEW